MKPKTKRKTALKRKVKAKMYKVGVWTRKGVPIRVHTLNIKAPNIREAEMKARKKVIRDNPDKPKRYFFVSTY